MDRYIIEVYDKYTKSLIGSYNSISEAMQKLNITSKVKGNIQSCIEGKRLSASGYLWNKKLIPFKTLPNEEWKDCKGYEGYYKVSNLGRVISTQFHGKSRCKLLKVYTDKLGYKFVTIHKWGMPKKHYAIHRLVALAFLPNPNNKPQVDHIDTNPSNNIAENLRWVTNLENQNNPKTLKKLQDSLTRYNKSLTHKYQVQESQGKSIILFDLSFNIIAKYPSLNDAAIKLKTSAGSLSRVCTTKRIYRKKYYVRFL